MNGEREKGNLFSFPSLLLSTWSDPECGAVLLAEVQWVSCRQSRGTFHGALGLRGLCGAGRCHSVKYYLTDAWGAGITQEDAFR